MHIDILQVEARITLQAPNTKRIFFANSLTQKQILPCERGFVVFPSQGYVISQQTVTNGGML
jgi:hypothetical protein